MRVLAQVCVRNESERYWSSWLAWHAIIFGAENIHVYDDRSDDKTQEMARDAGVRVTLRDEDTPAFLKHEGRFRQAGWNAMEAALQPERGDWIFAIDADEFLVSRGDEQADLYRACQWANHQGRGALLVSIPEVWSSDLDDDDKLTDLKVRTDGWWPQIIGTRLLAWQPNGKFSERAMGSGSEPSYVQSLAKSSLQNMWLLHFGYARPEDVAAKWERYSAHPGAHANSHIQSINQQATVTPWDGPMIDVYLGRRPDPGSELVVVGPDEEIGYEGHR